MRRKKNISFFERLNQETDLKLQIADIHMRARWLITFLLIIGIISGLIGALISSLLQLPIEVIVLTFLLFFMLFQLLVYTYIGLRSSARVAKIEEMLPDFLSLMASNIRSGMTYEQSLIMSARKEFGPLSKEIDMAAKDIIGGKPLTETLLTMTVRIPSEKFAKTVRLIVEGVNSGGNLAELLEHTAIDIRKFEGLRKDIASSMMSYALFIFAAAAIGAPLLYGVATFLIKVLYTVKSSVAFDTKNLPMNVPISMATSSLSPDLVRWFALCSIAITCFFGSLAAGLIFKGKEMDGIIYLPVTLLIATIVFFTITFILENAFKGMLPA